MNKHAESAQIESEDVAAVRVRSTGESAIKAKNTKSEDLIAFAPSKVNLGLKIEKNCSSLTGLSWRFPASRPDDLPHGIAQDIAADCHPHQKTGVERVAMKPRKYGNKDEDRGYVLRDTARR